MYRCELGTIMKRWRRKFNSNPTFQDDSNIPGASELDKTLPILKPVWDKISNARYELYLEIHFSTDLKYVNRCFRIPI